MNRTVAVGLILASFLALGACSPRGHDAGPGPAAVDFVFARDPMDSPFLDEYVRAYRLLGDGRTADAEAIYRELQEKEPGSTHPLVGLAACAMIRSETAPAIALYHQALDRNPRSIDARIGLASAYLMEERGEETLEAYFAAERVAPDHPMVHWGLAVAYHRLGRAAEARKRLERLRRLAPDSPQIGRLEKLLAPPEAD